MIKALEVIIYGMGIPTRYLLRDGDNLYYCNEGIMHLQLFRPRSKHPHLLITQKPKKGGKNG